MPLFSFKRENVQELTLEELPVRSIVPNPNQPRRTFDEDSIMELAASIEQVGLLQPLLVRRAGGVYELIAGERRLRAVMRLGHSTVKCLVDPGVDEASSAIMAVVENLQRQDLHFFEEAECYAALLEKLGITQDELAARIGKSQSFIANKLRVLRLPPQTRKRIIGAGLSERHARALLRLRTDDEREAAAEHIAAKGLSVKETEKYVDSLLQARAAIKPRPRMIRIFRDYRLFLNTISAACEQLRESGLGVSFDQNELEGGVEILIRVTQK